MREQLGEVGHQEVVLYDAELPREAHRGGAAAAAGGALWDGEPCPRLLARR